MKTTCGTIAMFVAFAAIAAATSAHATVCGAYSREVRELATKTVKDYPAIVWYFGRNPKEASKAIDEACATSKVRDIDFVTLLGRHVREPLPYIVHKLAARRNILLAEFYITLRDASLNVRAPRP